MDSFRISEASPAIQNQEKFFKPVTSGDANFLKDGKMVADGLKSAQEQSTQKTKNEIKIEDVKKAAEKLNSSLEIIQTKIQISIDDQTGKLVVKIINSENGDIIREVPPKNVLKLAARIAEYIGDWHGKEETLEGTVIDKKI